MAQSMEQVHDKPVVVLMHSVRTAGEVKPTMFATLTSLTIIRENVRRWRHGAEMRSRRHFAEVGERAHMVAGGAR